MLGSFEKMVLISPTSSHQWPQNQIDEQKSSMASAGNRAMEKTGQEQQQQNQQQLKCPRCDSSNTKFCYYNNYSLSQPRHFCKACKRYWTRGGTLRNVPVGGGCRKNKRPKRPSAASSSPIEVGSSSSCSASFTNSNPSSQPKLENPILYGLQNSVSVPFQRLFCSGVSSHADSVSGFDPQVQTQMINGGLGLGFSSGENGFNLTRQILASYNTSSSSSPSSLFSSFSSSTPVMSSLLSSTLQHQKFMNGGLKDHGNSAFNFQGLSPFEGMQVGDGNGSSSEGGILVGMKGSVKGEEGQQNNNISQNQISQVDHLQSSDPNSLYWYSSTAIGSWNDQSNIVSSVTSLI